jgi:hypothetical protein
MSIKLGSLHITVPQLLLHGADVGAIFQPMSRKRVPQGMTGDIRLNARCSRGPLAYLVDGRLIHMVAPQIYGTRFKTQAG